MPAPYNYPTGTTTFEGMFTYINTEVTGYFGISILIAIFVIPFAILQQKFGTLRAFATSSWITFLASWLLTILGLTPQIAIAGSFTLLLISMLLLWRGDK